MQEELNSTAITANLGTKLIGSRVVYHPSLPSTNSLAKEEARRGAPEGTTVVTGRQTEGRGRMKRQWLTPEGGLAFSVVLCPDVAHLPYLIMLSSLAVAHGIEQVTGLKPQLKWPNDVLIAGKKVCGILVETDVRRNKVEYAVIGIGINVNVKIADLPEIKDIATSLCDELGHDVSRLELLRQILVEMERLYLALPAGERVYAEWRDRLITLGKKVTVTAGDSRIEGIAESVTESGSLLLRCADGTLKEIVAGDVSLREAK